MIKLFSNRVLMPLALFILLSYAAFAKPISLEEAKEIAMQHNLQMNKYSIELQDPSAYKLIASSHDIFSKATQNPTFYIYNFPQKGWVIVAGDDIARPILAYSKEDSYGLENLPDAAKYWLEIYDSAISEAIKQGVSQSDKIANEWLLARNPKKRNSLLAEVVPPLIKTKWGQKAPYNNLCPFDEEVIGRTLTGCVATTMAQIMKYWNFPKNGKGEKTYTHPKYGKLSADFENTTYDWDNMTNEYIYNSTKEQRKAVATLMYHCGVASEMYYGVEASGTHEFYIVSYLKTYFMYDPAIRRMKRSNYNDNTWTDMLKENLDNDQPMAYSGGDASSGHSFICDGYDTDGRFHFNFGWDGMGNGYYYINNVTLNSDDYSLMQYAIINIKPLENFNAQISLLKPLELKQEVVYQNSSVKINANIVNNESESFSGRISLRLFDAKNNFLMTIAEQKIDNLEINKPTEIPFETNPLFNTSVGKYYIKLYYKNDISYKWLLASGDNKLEIDIQKALSSENKLSLYSSPILSAYKIDKEKESNLKTTASFINTSEEDFKGIISASIYDEKGTIIKELASYNVTEALAPNTYIKDIEFSSAISDLDYGTYFIGFRSKDEGGEFALVNTNNFISFVKFEIVPPDLITDSQLKKWIKSNKGQLSEVIINNDGGIDSTTTNLEALAKIEELGCSSFELISINELIRHMPNLNTLICNNNSLIELDLSKNIELTYLDCSENQLMNLDVSKNIKLIELDCYENRLNELDLSKNIELTHLDCSENQLSNLDVSKNIKLIELDCYDNQLNELTISNNIELEFLDCHANQLTNLDMSKNIILEKLYCWSNQLIDLDVSKNIELMLLDCSENQLTNLDISKNIILDSLYCSKNKINNLDLTNNINLINLDCSENQLTNLDISKNIILEKLYCWSNQLNNLNVTKNINLTFLLCFENQLSNLDLINNINLTFLLCSGNQLNNLDLSKNINIEILECSKNQINNLDLTNNINLMSLGCSGNQLSNLDLKNNMNLIGIVCSDNQLSSLDVSPLTNLWVLNCCNQAEGFILYLTDAQKGTFTEENYCNAILKEKDGSICEIEWLDVYPNPTAGKFVINSKFLSDEIKILNLAGEVLYRETLSAEKTEIDISNLPAGVYLVITKGKIGKVVKN